MLSADINLDIGLSANKIKISDVIIDLLCDNTSLWLNALRR